MNMPSDEYNKISREVADWSGSKDALQRLYDEIYYKYDDGHEILERLESLHQRRFSGMNTHQLGDTQ